MLDLREDNLDHLGNLNGAQRDEVHQRGALPPSVRVRETPDGLLFELPRRRTPLGPRLFSVGLVVLGLGVIIMGMYISGLLGMQASGWWFAGWIAGGAAMIALGLVLVWWGAYPNLARDVVTLNEQWLRCTTHLGPLAWSRRVLRDDVRTVRLVRVTFRARTTGVYKRMLDASGWYILVESTPQAGDAARVIRLVTWYPYAILEPLADELARWLDARRESAVQYLDANPAEDALSPRTVDPPTPPPWTDIDVASAGEHLTIVVPPSPLLRGGSGRSTVGMLMRVITGAIVGMVVISFVFGGRISSAWMWMGLLFGVPAMRGWFALLGERLGRRETYFDLVDDTLLVSRKRYLDVIQHEWQRSDIVEVRCDASDIKIADELLPQLQIVTRDGQVLGLLTGRDEDELTWLAWRLHTALRLPMRPASSGAVESGQVAVE